MLGLVADHSSFGWALAANAALMAAAAFAFGAFARETAGYRAAASTAVAEQAPASSGD